MSGDHDSGIMMSYLTDASEVPVGSSSAGLLLRLDTGRRYHSLATAAARHAGHVYFGLTVRRSNVLVQ